MLGLLGKREKADEKEGILATTPSGAVLRMGDDAELLKSLLESAAVNQPKLAEHITENIKDYIERIDESYRELFEAVLHPAPLFGDATEYELADLLSVLYIQKFRFTSGPRFMSKGEAETFDLYFNAARPILRLALNSHLLHLSMRYFPIRGGVARE